MWKETKIFNAEDTLGDVMNWVGHKKNVVLSTPKRSRCLLISCQVS